MNVNEKEMYLFAETLINHAGSFLRQEREKNALNAKDKTCHSDIVTDQDVLIENYLSAAITEKYKGHAILAEENHCGTELSHYCYTWIIDPIDGTFNFYRYAKDYAISLALYHDGAPVFGLVYDVPGDILYKGIIGEHPPVIEENGEHNGQSELLRDAVVAMSYTTMHDLSAMETDVFNLLSKVSAHRYLGCASLELCKVATGDYDIYLSTNVYEWDIAAARVLVRQSGGHMISYSNPHKKGKLFVAAFRSPAVWHQLLEYCSDEVRRVFEPY